MLSDGTWKAEELGGFSDDWYSISYLAFLLFLAVFFRDLKSVIFKLGTHIPMDIEIFSKEHV